MTDIITITGNIATAPEHKVLPSGVPVTRFRVASGTRRFDRETNAWIDGPTNWYSVSAYRTLGENAANSLQKGERIVVTGRLRLRAWESDGRKGLEAEIDADALGHDLLFGTSTFRRTASRGTPPQGEASADVPSADETQAAWTMPGAQGDGPADWGSTVSMTTGDLAPVPQPAPGAEPVETPF